MNLSLFKTLLPDIKDAYHRGYHVCELLMLKLVGLFLRCRPAFGIHCIVTGIRCIVVPLLTR